MFKQLKLISIVVLLMISTTSCRVSGGGGLGSGPSTGFSGGGGTTKPDRELVDDYDGGKLMSLDTPVHEDAFSIHKKNKTSAPVKRIKFEKFYAKGVREIITSEDKPKEAMAIATFTLDSINMYNNINYSTSGTSLVDEVAKVNVLTVNGNGTCKGKIKRIETDAEIHIECYKQDENTLYVISEVIDE